MARHHVSSGSLLLGPAVLVRQATAARVPLSPPRPGTRARTRLPRWSRSGSWSPFRAGSRSHAPTDPEPLHRYGTRLLALAGILPGRSQTRPGDAALTRRTAGPRPSLTCEHYTLLRLRYHSSQAGNTASDSTMLDFIFAVDDAVSVPTRVPPSYHPHGRPRCIALPGRHARTTRAFVRPLCHHSGGGHPEPSIEPSSGHLLPWPPSSMYTTYTQHLISPCFALCPALARRLGTTPTSSSTPGTTRCRFVRSTAAAPSAHCRGRAYNDFTSFWTILVFLGLFSRCSQTCSHATPHAPCDILFSTR